MKKPYNSCKSWDEEVVVYHDFPQDEHIVTERIGDADCLLVSFRTPIRKSVLDACRNITIHRHVLHTL